MFAQHVHCAVLVVSAFQVCKIQMIRSRRKKRKIAISPSAMFQIYVFVPVCKIQNVLRKLENEYGSQFYFKKLSY
jgi:hypothetical protein